LRLARGVLDLLRRHQLELVYQVLVINLGLAELPLAFWLLLAARISLVNFELFVELSVLVVKGLIDLFELLAGAETGFEGLQPELVILNDVLVAVKLV
jgi:hypothetical protein